MEWTFNEPYESEGLEPDEIRSDFIAVTHSGNPHQMLRRLACYLPSATLAEFLDDLAMGRI